VNAYRREMSRAALGAVVLFGIVAASTLAYAARGGSERDVAIVLLMNLVIVLGLQVFAGNSGVLTLAHVSFAGIAAYVTAILSTPALVKGTLIGSAPLGLAKVELPVPVAMLVAIVVTTALAALIGLALARLSGISATIVTLALVIVVFAVLTNWKSVTGGAEAFYGIPSTTTIWWALVAALVAILVARLFKASKLGLRVQSTREDAVAAAATGVRVVRARYWAWVLSCALCALGGVLMAHFLGAISPAGFYFTLLFLTLTMLVLGGEYSVTGAVVGTLLITIVAEITRYLGDGPVLLGWHVPALAGLSLLVQGAIIIVVMIWKPSGLLGDREVDGLFRRRAAAGAPAATPPPLAEPAPVTAPAVETSAPAGVPAALVVTAASKHFAGLAAVLDVSLEVGRGEIVGLIGPNGAGKTTLLNLVSGMYAPSTGAITLDGVRLDGLPSHDIARLGIARTFQTTKLFRELTVRQNLEVAASVALRHRPGIARSAEDVLTEFGFQQIADRKAGILPYGRQREVEIARAVAQAPAVLLLDEPAAGLNDEESMELVKVIRGIRDQVGCGVLLIDHDLHFVMALCERMYVLDAGRVIAAGTPAEVQGDPLVVEAYLGTRGAGRASAPAARETHPGSAPSLAEPGDLIAGA
jgi:branched-chain amino acid transport system permease protein